MKKIYLIAIAALCASAVARADERGRRGQFRDARADAD